MIRDEQLSKVSKDLMLKEPFYGLFLIMLNKKWTTKEVPTAGVGLNGLNYELYINEEFWDKLGATMAQDPKNTGNSQRGLLKHELLHIAFMHLTEFKQLNNPLLRNIAEDIEINQYIVPEDLPPGPCLPDSFPELNLEPKKGTLYYYEKLLKGAKDGNCPALNNAIAADAIGQMSFKAGKDGKGNDATLPSHGMWDKMDDLNEATKKLIQKQSEYILKEVAEQVQKSRGTIPSELAEIIQKITELEPPKFDWRGYLRRFTGGSVVVYTKKSRRKYNKRYLENPGLKIKHRRHILVAIDTSGSVSTPELKEFVNELYHMHKTGTEITVVECDAAISHIQKFDPRRDFEIHGRGGTSFDPVIEYYNENLNKYTCLVYFTDGEAPAPPRPLGKNLWVLSSRSNETDHLPGPVIKLEL
jgi:predicted metal-dependent peptidase